MPDTLNANYVPMVLGILEPVVLQEVKRQAIIFALFVVYYCLLILGAICPGAFFTVYLLSLNHFSSY
jgi:hypothetical protein